MFEIKQYWKITLVLLLIIFINILFLYSVYNDLLFALFVPLSFCGLNIGIAILFEKFGFMPSGKFPPRRPFDEQGGLIPLGRLLGGIVIPLLFAWDDPWTHPDHLVEPWFWSSIISAYLGWVIGIASVRFRNFKKKSEISIENGPTVEM